MLTPKTLTQQCGEGQRWLMFFITWLTLNRPAYACAYMRNLCAYMRNLLKSAPKYATYMRYMRALCGIGLYAENCESSHIYAYAIFEMPKCAERYAMCRFSQNMRYLLWSLITWSLKSDIPNQCRIKGGAMGAAVPGPAISRGPHFWEVQKNQLMKIMYVQTIAHHVNVVINCVIVSLWSTQNACLHMLGAGVWGWEME